MGVLSRLPALAIVASLALALPAQADDGGGSAPPDGGCEDPETCDPKPRDNSTSGSGGNSTSPPAPSPPPPPSPGPLPPPPPQPGNVTPPQSGISLVDNYTQNPPCELIRPTGSRPHVSVNPILGILEVNSSCILRHLRGAVAVQG